MGQRAFTNREAHERLERERYSDLERRMAEEAIAADDAKWSRMASDQYTSTTGRLKNDLDAVLRICEAGSETVKQILEEMRNGDITATEAARALAAARRDLNKLRHIAHEAESTEEQVWTEVNVSPAEYQEQLMRRAPVLFTGGRNRVVIPTTDDD